MSLAPALKLDWHTRHTPLYCNAVVTVSALLRNVENNHELYRPLDSACAY